MSLDRLQKEIDALTYNARTVLNALIRSVTAAGNNQGFKATRAGEVIFLNRIDIYRLYKFYQEWAANQFATEDKVATEESGALDGFDTIRARHDETPVTADNGEQDTTATSTALAKHGKILFKTNDNANNTDEQWIALVKNHNNPKLVSNSSPIPLYLRSPVFDENLSTAHYHNYPTYLFPMDYFKMDVMGYSGDDTEHHLDGKSWTFDADEFVKIASKKIELGDIIPEAEYKTADKRTGNYGLSFGYNCHAQAAYSVAGGRSCIVPSNTSVEGQSDTTHAIAVGNSNIASDIDSVAIGGKLNSVANQYAGIIGGSRNSVTAISGVALGGESNIVGGKLYTFRFPTGVVSTNTSGGETGTTTTEGEVTTGNNVIMVYGNQSTVFAKGQQVTIYNFHYKSSNGSNSNLYYDANGSARQAIHDIVDGAEFVATGSTSPDAGWTRITLRNDIPEKGIITGGSVSITRSETGISLGRSSAAIGRNLIVEGDAQLAVGISNRVQRDAKFLVGAGNKSNSFEVYNNRFVAYGIRNSTNSFTDGINSPKTRSRNSATSFVGLEFAEKGLDVLVEHNRLRLFKDVIINNEQRSGFEMSSQIGTAGEELGIKADTAYGISLYSQHRYRNITLHTGTDDIIRSFGGSSKSGDIGLFSQKRIYIVGKEGVTIRAATGGETQGILTLEWQTSLKLIGNSWGTLPTDQNQYAHYMIDAISVTNAQYLTNTENWGVISLYKTGFYRVNGVTNPIIPSQNVNKVNINVTGQQSATDYFLLNTGYVNNLNEYFNWQMFIGSDPRISNDVHIGVRRGYSKNATESTYYTNNANNGSNIKYIGWLQDYQYSYGLVTPSNPEQVNFGKWSQIPSTLISAYQGIAQTAGAIYGEVSYDTSMYDLLSGDPGLSGNTVIKYTKMNNLIFFHVTIVIPPLYFGASSDTDKAIAIIIKPADGGTSWDTIFMPKSSATFPTFIDSRKYREYSGTDKTWYKLYTCQAIRNQSDSTQFRFLITTSAANADISETANIFASDNRDNATTLNFTGSYETQYSTTEE